MTSHSLTSKMTSDELFVTDSFCKHFGPDNRCDKFFLEHTLLRTVRLIQKISNKSFCSDCKGLNIAIMIIATT